MPSVFVPKSLFPNVPPLPGVPQLVRQTLINAQDALVPLQAVLDTGLLIREIILLSVSQKPVWGVFDTNNVRVITPDNIYSFTDRAEWRVSDYPVQRGAFASFNKVILPFEDTLRMTKGGSQSDRKAFLDQIDKIAGDTNEYNILTPEKTYIGVNIIRRELVRRSSEGAYFLEVDIYFRQIINVDAQYSTTAANTANATNPPAKPVVNQGNVQPQVPVPNKAASAATTAIAGAPL